MTPERWREIDRVFQAALECEPRERLAFLDEVCRDDGALRKEVEQLLSCDDQEDCFIDAPALEAAASFLALDEPALTAGQHLSHYEILDLLGTGGMGEVYLAQDETLGRKVALKLLPTDYTRDKDRLRRFQQEAQAASALNHPNILTIYELGHVNGQQFIATELVEGETLRRRMKRGGLNLGTALEITTQVASALLVAHRAGIIHRDIKPENIMLRPDGYVKVLDFGLAKLTEHDETLPQAETSDRVDISSGLVMGTVRYMSPEQARGIAVDERSDIFSLGVVIYEMIAGHAPFEGETPRDQVAAILRTEPQALTARAPDTPPQLQQIVSKTLRKDKQDRYRTIRDLLADLGSLKDELDLKSKLEQTRIAGEQILGDDSLAATQPLTRSGRSTVEAGIVSAAPSAEYLVSQITQHKSWVATVFALILITTAIVSYWKYKGFSKRSTHETLNLTRVTTSGHAADAAISPDGQYVAYVASVGGEQSIWIRQVATNSNVQIVAPGTGSFGGLTFSRDGSYLYYFGSSKSDPDPSLYQMPALGGLPRKLIAGIVNSSGTGPASFSPDGKYLAFVRESPTESALFVANVDGTEERKLASRTDPNFFSSASWSPDGKSIACVGVYQQEGILHFGLVGVGIQDGVEKPISTREFAYIGDIAWLSDGSGLLLIASELANESNQIWEIAYPAGSARRISADLNDHAGLSLTADSSALITVLGGTVINIWTQPTGDASQAKQITSGGVGRDGWAGIGWTPDGRIVYSSHASGRPDIWVMNADGSNPKQITVDLGSNSHGLSVSPDGRYVVFVSKQRGHTNIWRVDTDGNNPKQLTNGSGDSNPFFSPDGQWVRYGITDAGAGITRKVAVDGSENIQDAYANIVAISPDGNFVAYIPADDQSQGDRIAIGPIGGGAPITILNLPPGALLGRIRWAPDGHAITYIINRKGVGNIWSQPLEGGPAQQLTDFKADQIFDLAWSRDGKQLAIVRGTQTRDVVLMKNFR